MLVEEFKIQKVLAGICVSRSSRGMNEQGNCSKLEFYLLLLNSIERSSTKYLVFTKLFTYIIKHFILVNINISIMNYKINLTP